MVIKAGLRTPADVQGRVNVRLGPFHDFNQLVPVFDLLERHQLNRCACDDKAVVTLVADVVERLVERQQMILGRVFRVVGLGLNKIDLDLNRRVGQTAENLRFGYDFQRHQIEDGDAERADALRRCAVLGHNENVFAFQNRTRGQTVRYFYRQREQPLIYSDECSEHRNLRRVSKRSGIIYIITAIAENSKVKENRRKMKKVVDRRVVSVVFY